MMSIAMVRLFMMSSTFATWTGAPHNVEREGLHDLDRDGVHDLDGDGLHDVDRDGLHDLDGDGVHDLDGQGLHDLDGQGLHDLDRGSICPNEVKLDMMLLYNFTSNCTAAHTKCGSNLHQLYMARYEPSTKRTEATYWTRTGPRLHTGFQLFQKTEAPYLKRPRLHMH